MIKVNLFDILVYVFFFFKKWFKNFPRSNFKQQGRIHGHQLRTGGRGRKCAIYHFSTRWLRRDGPTEGRTDGPTDGWTDGRTNGQSLLQSCVSATKNQQKNAVSPLKSPLSFPKGHLNTSYCRNLLNLSSGNKDLDTKKTAHFQLFSLHQGAHEESIFTVKTYSKKN